MLDLATNCLFTFLSWVSRVRSANKSQTDREMCYWVNTALNISFYGWPTRLPTVVKQIILQAQQRLLYKMSSQLASTNIGSHEALDALRLGIGYHIGPIFPTTIFRTGIDFRAINQYLFINSGEITNYQPIAEPTRDVWTDKQSTSALMLGF